MASHSFLDAHLNVNWLRPESALWDAIASSVVSQFPLLSPSLDLGSGNGIFSFITAGGVFSSDYDWYRNANPQGFWKGQDIYDYYFAKPDPSWIIKKPMYRIDVAMDMKANLLRQAKSLGFYHHTSLADGNAQLPFQDNSFQTVFSNIVYWLRPPETSLKEIRRVLLPKGRALLCLQDSKFYDHCVSFQWLEHNSEILRLLNRGRGELGLWTISYAELMSLARKLGFQVISHSYYLSPLTLKVWDIGLRPLSPVLIKIIDKLSDSDRQSLKEEWIQILRPFLLELYELDRKSNDQGGFHFICLEKI